MLNTGEGFHLSSVSSSHYPIFCNKSTVAVDQAKGTAVRPYSKRSAAASNSRPRFPCDVFGCKGVSRAYSIQKDTEIQSIAAEPVPHRVCWTLQPSERTFDLKPICRCYSLLCSMYT